MLPKNNPSTRLCKKNNGCFKLHEIDISTKNLKKGLTSNEVLTILRDDLISIGFQVESGKLKTDKIQRPVFFGENGEPTLRYEIDAYNPEWKCGLEVEAGRAWMGNAIYRDLIQGLVMVEVDYLTLAVPNSYKYKSSGRSVVSSDYQNTVNVADTLFGHTRVKLPYNLIVIGY